jgi:hypothetical protein
MYFSRSALFLRRTLLSSISQRWLSIVQDPMHYGFIPGAVWDGVPDLGLRSARQANARDVLEGYLRHWFPAAQPTSQNQLCGRQIASM